MFNNNRPATPCNLMLTAADKDTEKSALITCPRPTLVAAELPWGELGRQ